jgi:hypothetical protein
MINSNSSATSKSLPTAVRSSVFCETPKVSSPVAEPVLEKPSMKLFTEAAPSPKYLLVEESQLQQLLQKAFCSCDKTINQKTKGHAITFYHQCHKCKLKTQTWSTSTMYSWPSENSKPITGFRVNAASISAWIAFGGTQTQFEGYFAGLGCFYPKDDCWQKVQSEYAALAITVADLQERYLYSSLNRDLALALDGRYTSARTAEHCSVSVLEYESKFILRCESAHSKEAYDVKGTYNDFAGSLEPILARKALKYLSNALPGKIKKLIVDGQGQFLKLFDTLKEQKILPADCKYCLDGWHKRKSVVKNLPTLSSCALSKKEFNNHVKTHFDFAVNSCKGDAQKFVKTWNNAPRHWFGCHEECPESKKFKFLRYKYVH